MSLFKVSPTLHIKYLFAGLQQVLLLNPTPQRSPLLLVGLRPHMDCLDSLERQNPEPRVAIPWMRLAVDRVPEFFEV